MCRFENATTHLAPVFEGSEHSLDVTFEGVSRRIIVPNFTKLVVPQTMARGVRKMDDCSGHALPTEHCSQLEASKHILSNVHVTSVITRVCYDLTQRSREGSCAGGEILHLELRHDREIPIRNEAHAQLPAIMWIRRFFCSFHDLKDPAFRCLYYVMHAASCVDQKK